MKARDISLRIAAAHSIILIFPTQSLFLHSTAHLMVVLIFKDKKSTNMQDTQQSWNSINFPSGCTEIRCMLCDALITPSSGLADQNQGAPSLTAKDLQISDKSYGETLPLLHCPQCSFLFVDRLMLSNLENLYSQMEDSAYVDSQQSRAQQARWLVDKMLGKNLQIKSALDIGAGSGLLVKELKSRGILTQGIEPSRSLVDIGKRLYDVDLICGTFKPETVTLKNVDLIFLIDVIEHVNDPLELLKSAAERLGENGEILVITPDLSSFAAKLLKKRWWHFRKAHVSYFDKNSLRLCVAKVGLTDIEWFRAPWILPLGYLLERVGEYSVFLKWVFKLSHSNLPFIHAIMSTPISFNLQDSWAVRLKKKAL